MTLPRPFNRDTLGPNCYEALQREHLFDVAHRDATLLSYARQIGEVDALLDRLQGTDYATLSAFVMASTLMLFDQLRAHVALDRQDVPKWRPYEDAGFMLSVADRIGERRPVCAPVATTVAALVTPAVPVEVAS